MWIKSRLSLHREAGPPCAFVFLDAAVLEASLSNSGASPLTCCLCLSFPGFGPAFLFLSLESDAAATMFDCKDGSRGHVQTHCLEFRQKLSTSVSSSPSCSVFLNAIWQTLSRLSYVFTFTFLRVASVQMHNSMTHEAVP